MQEFVNKKINYAFIHLNEACNSMMERMQKSYNSNRHSSFTVIEISEDNDKKV